MKDPKSRKATPAETVYYRNKLVVEFIERRFQSTDDASWMDGNCYWFARILCDRFSFLQLGYDPIIGHFYAVYEDGETMFDFEGKHPLCAKVLLMKTIKKIDKLWYNRLVHDCIE